LEEVIERSGSHLVLLDSLQALYHTCARSIADEIKRNNETARVTRLILPVGPTEQYSILKDMINDEKISLKNCCFFFMDEYCDYNAIELPAEHPLSFKGTMNRIGFFDQIKPELRIKEENIVFPNHNNLFSLSGLLSKEPIDTCYGGIGIHGHVAFNEPETNIAETGPRLVRLNDYTITINALRAGVGGNLVNFPHYALSLGMREVLSSKRIRLMCRSETSLDWACTILRIALLAKVGDDFPVTHIRMHKDWKIMSTNETAAGPKHLI
jgi:glucosamine-6-phosphate deaminase